MKKIGVYLLGASLLAACADDEEPLSPEGSSNPSDVEKGEVDRAALEDGLSVELTSVLGSVDVPFAVAVPDASDDDLRAAFSESVSLIVKNNDSGATTNLMSGSLVSEEPSDNGEYALSLNDDRDTLTVTFYNSTSAGQTLNTDGDYTSTISISSNDYVSSLGTTAVDVSVK